MRQAIGEERDKLFFDQIKAELIEDEIQQTQARVNKIDTPKFALNDKFIDKLIGRMDQNQEIFEKIREDRVFGDRVKELMKEIYKKLNEQDKLYKHTNYSSFQKNGK